VKHAKQVVIVAKNNTMKAASVSHTATPYEAEAFEISLLMCTLAAPNRLKSMTTSTRVMTQAIAAMIDANKNPTQCDPAAIKNAMNATPVATGWRTRALVRFSSAPFL